MITNFTCILNILPDYKVKNSEGCVWTMIKQLLVIRICQELSQLHKFHCCCRDTELIKKKEPRKSMRLELGRLLNTQKTSLSNRPSTSKIPKPCSGTAKENLISPNPHQGTPSCSPDSHTYN